MKAYHECVETLRRDGGMSKDTGELIKKKSKNLCCQPIFSYISSLIIVPNAPFSQSLSHILKNITSPPKGLTSITLVQRMRVGRVLL